MQTGAVILGNHANFFREGSSFTVPSAGTAGRASKPGANDAGWVYLGILSQVTAQNNREEREIFAPSPGRLRLYDVLETKSDLVFKLEVQEMSSLAFEHIFGTLNLAASGSSLQYNPLEGQTKRGWLKIQQYTGTDALYNTVDVFVHLKISGEVTFGDNVVSATFEARVLHSTLNTGTLA